MKTTAMSNRIRQMALDEIQQQKEAERFTWKPGDIEVLDGHYDTDPPPEAITKQKRE